MKKTVIGSAVACAGIAITILINVYDAALEYGKMQANVAYVKESQDKVVVDLNELKSNVATIKSILIRQKDISNRSVFSLFNSTKEEKNASKKVCQN